MPHIVRDPTLPFVGGMILVVEDNPMIRDVVQALLESEGLPVTAIGDSRAAVAWAEQNEPALVVLDLGLPFMDGVAVASILRARYGALLPILVVSADHQAHAKTRHLRPCGVVRKPFDADALVAAVQRGLDRNGTC